MINKYYGLDILALIAGLILPLAFAPFWIYPLAFISPLLILYVWCHSTPRAAARRGFLFGLGYFGIGVSWLYISIHNFGQAPPILAGLITFSFISYLAFFFALQGYCLSKYCPDNSLFKLLLLSPALWLINECLRTWLFTGFPWLLLGYSQTQTWLKGYAPLFSVYGVSVITTVISGLLLAIYLNKNLTRRRTLASTIVVLFFSGYLLSNIAWTTSEPSPLTVTMIQGNIQQDVKWQPEQIERTLALYSAHTQSNWSSQLIIWPEAAVTLPLKNARDFLNEMSTQAKRHHSTVITGIPVIDATASHNSMIALGAGSGLYHKRHLVPFGEYIPLKPFWGFMLNVMHIPMSNFERGAVNQKSLNAQNILIAPYICYEIAYPVECLDFLPQAQLLLTITDDSWFGHSIASAQHLQMAQMRAIETGRYLLFSSNTGITAAIDSQGKIVKSLPEFEEAVLTTQVTPKNGATPWVVWRMGPLISFLMVVLALLIKQRRAVKASIPETVC